MHIPLVYEHLFYKYFVRRSVGNATKGFATYGCFHPCFQSTQGSYGIQQMMLHNIKLSVSLNYWLMKGLDTISFNQLIKII